MNGQGEGAHARFQVSTSTETSATPAAFEQIRSPCPIEIKRIWTLDLNESKDISVELERFGQARAHSADVVDLSQRERGFSPPSFPSKFFQPVHPFEHVLRAPFAPALSVGRVFSPSFLIPMVFPPLAPSILLSHRSCIKLSPRTRARSFRSHLSNGHTHPDLLRSGPIPSRTRFSTRDPSGSNRTSFRVEPGSHRVYLLGESDVSET